MSARFVATFFSHFGATRFRRMCKERNIACELAPVPRSLSSSCGTCAFFDAVPLKDDESWSDEIELVAQYSATDDSWDEIYRAEGA